MALKIVLDDVAPVAEGVWVTNLSPDQLRAIGQAPTRLGDVSVVLLPYSAPPDDNIIQVVFEPGEARVLNAGTGDRAVLVFGRPEPPAGDESERHGHAKQYSQILIAIGRKGDLTSKVRESLVSVGRVVTFLSAVMEGVKWSKDMREQLKTMQRDVASLTDHASYLSNKITFVLDAMLGVVNLEQNNIIKLFSVMAVVLMPPTLIASIYGMNFKAMPELEWAHGYPMALVMMLMAAVLPYFLFKWKKWL